MKDPNLDDWVRHRTPPNSPPPSYNQTMGPTARETSTSEKMSLDFIAPGSCSLRQTQPRPSSPSLDRLSEISLVHRRLKINGPNSPVSMASFSGNRASNSPPSCNVRLPSPTWSSSSVSNIRSQLQLTQLRRPQTHRPTSRPSYQAGITHKRQQHRIQKRQATPPPPYTLSQAPQRGERPGYCPEARYAIIYLRGVLNYKWSDVLDRFTLLFPPGQISRCQITGLPDTYPKRDVQGLQCRWYRIREEEGLVPLRDTQFGVGEMTPERRVLERMASEGKLSLGFAGLVEDVGELGV